MNVSVATEAERKRSLALAAAGGYLVSSRPWDVRWLLCGRGRPVDASAPAAIFTIVLDGDRASVLYPNIEHPRVDAEERFEELGYELMPYRWHQGHGLSDTRPVLDALRLELGDEERERYRHAGADAADAMRQALRTCRSSTRLAISPSRRNGVGSRLPWCSSRATNGSEFTGTRCRPELPSGGTPSSRSPRSERAFTSH
jgi:hypothetical protein